MQKISVIIPSYNSSLTIGRTLEGILAQPQDYLEEVIVVDSSDDDRTPQFLESFAARGVRVIRLEKRSIPAIGRNKGAESARAEILAFIDSDAVPEKDWLKNISAAFEDGCLAGGGPILLPVFQRRRMTAAAQYFLQFSGFLDAGSKRQAEFVPSCNLFCSRTLFHKTGGFPDIRACEDVLFGVQMNRQTPVTFLPEVRVSHIFRERLGAYLKNQVLLGRYIIIYRRQRFNAWIYRGLFPVIFLPFFALYKLLKIIANVFRCGQMRLLGIFLICFPLLFIGLWSWAWGFLKGCFEKDGSE